MPDFLCVTCDYEVLSLTSEMTVLSIIYRPPYGYCDNYFLFLEAFFRFISDNNNTMILRDDLNDNMLLDNHSKWDLNVIIRSNNCKNVITVPTRVTTDSATLLDIFITNFNSSNSDAGVITSTVSDHLSVLLCVKRSRIKNKQSQNTSSQNIRSDNLDRFRIEIRSLDGSDVLRETNVDKAYEIF